MQLTIVTPTECRHRGTITGTGFAHIHGARQQLHDKTPYDLLIVPIGHHIAQQTARHFIGPQVDERCLHLRNIHWTGLIDVHLTRVLNQNLNVAGICQTKSLRSLERRKNLIEGLTRFSRLAKEQLIDSINRYDTKRALVVMEGILLQATVSHILRQMEPFMSDVLDYCQGYEITGDPMVGWNCTPIL